MSKFTFITVDPSLMTQKLGDYESLKFVDNQENTNTHSLLSRDFISTLGAVKDSGKELESGMYLLNTLSTLESRYGLSTEEFIEEKDSRSRELNRISLKDIETWSRYSFIFND